MTTAANPATATLKGLHATPGAPLSFAPNVLVRGFVLERPAGNVAIYSADGLASEVAGVGGVTRHYLGHWHEAMVTPVDTDVPLFVHQGDRGKVDAHVRATFTRRHELDEDLEIIPIPGHTPGSTAYLWDNGEHRLLFTADSLYLSDGEWIGALLESSDRDQYLESLRLIRDLDFDVLVPWAATASDPYAVLTDADDRRARLDAVIARIEAGGSH